MDTASQIVEKIIKEQEAIIGPIAVEQARKVEGLEVVSDSDVKIVGNVKEVLTNLVAQYEKLFGKASVEVCREAVRGMIAQAPKDQIPQILV
jgi:hypothetical protein